MEGNIKKESLKDIVLREDASSEEVKKNDIAALRQRIDEDKQEIEQLTYANHKKKTAIIYLSVFLGLFVILSVAMLINFVGYDGNLLVNQSQTTTETLSETTTQIDELAQKADKNDDKAQYMMALRYFSGKDGYQIDKQQALEWFSRSANNQNIDAMLALGAMYESGDGIEKNNQSAFKYYFMASRFENKQALYKVGKFYYYGIGVDKNMEKSLLYLQKSANQDYQPAKTLMDIIKQETSEEKTQNVNQPQTETNTIKKLIF